MAREASNRVGFTMAREARQTGWQTQVLRALTYAVALYARARIT